MIRDVSQSSSGIILIERTFDAPRSLVFANWIDPREAAGWFAPDGFTAVHSEMDVKPGGKWRIDFRAVDGRLHTEYGVFLEVLTPERLKFTLTQTSGGEAGPETTVTVTFVDFGSRTRMRFKQSGYTFAANRDGNAEGWGECFAKLEAKLAISSPAETR